MNKINAFQLDCGRMFFEIEDILEFTEAMAEGGKNTLILAFGNEGCRFLLDDMSVKTETNCFSSEKVLAAVRKGNEFYRNCVLKENGNSSKNELNEAEMLRLFDLCKKNKIQIVPLLNSPGHMSALLKALEELGLKKVRYENSKTTIDLKNKEAVEVLKAVIQKYINWFAAQGCKYFHLGCDEYANDVLHNGFKSLQNPEAYSYDSFINYVNQMALQVKKQGMIPIMFNDGMYFGSYLKNEALDKNIICAYWSKGWSGYELTEAQNIKEKDHKILNTHNGWYYVLGRHDGDGGNQDFTIEKAFKGADEILEDEIAGCGKMDVIGKVTCLWCDEPCVLTGRERQLIKELIKAGR